MLRVGGQGADLFCVVCHHTSTVGRFQMSPPSAAASTVFKICAPRSVHCRIGQQFDVSVTCSSSLILFVTSAVCVFEFRDCRL